MAFGAFQDGVLRKVFAVALNPSHVDVNASPPVVHLADLEQARSIFYPFKPFSIAFITRPMFNPPLLLPPYKNLCYRNLGQRHQAPTMPPLLSSLTRTASNEL
jgi:hypothetical protein